MSGVGKQLTKWQLSSDIMAPPNVYFPTLVKLWIFILFVYSLYIWKALVWRYAARFQYQRAVVYTNKTFFKEVHQVGKGKVQKKKHTTER